MPDKKRYPYQNFSLKDIKGEQWDDIPFLDGAYQLSSYGRIKSLRRWTEMGNGGRWTEEKILKSYLKKQIVAKGTREQYFLCGSASFEGRQYSLPIARLAYYLFVEKFDLDNRRLVVICRDENPVNIHPDNLLLISKSSFMVKSYRNNRRDRKCFENKPLAVSQYDMNGKWIATFPSISAAAAQTGILSGNISDALKNRSSFSNNFMWRYGDSRTDMSVPRAVEKLLAGRQRYAGAISQYDLNGKKVTEYPNLKTATKILKVKEEFIKHTLLGHTMTRYGYIWKAGSGPETISVAYLQAARELKNKKISRIVSQYDLTGKKLKTYSSIMEASRQLKMSHTSIFSALKNEGERIGSGFLWTYGDGPDSIEVPERVKRSFFLRQLYYQPVTQYNLQGENVAVFESLKTAAKQTNNYLQSLVDAVTGKQLTCGGCYWRLGKGRAKKLHGAAKKNIDLKKGKS